MLEDRWQKSIRYCVAWLCMQLTITKNNNKMFQLWIQLFCFWTLTWQKLCNVMSLHYHYTTTTSTSTTTTTTSTWLRQRPWPWPWHMRSWQADLSGRWREAVCQVTSSLDNDSLPPTTTHTPPSSLTVTLSACDAAAITIRTVTSLDGETSSHQLSVPATTQYLDLVLFSFLLREFGIHYMSVTVNIGHFLLSDVI